MATLGHVYRGHLIWRDAFRWIVRARDGSQARFKTLTAAKGYIDRNPRPV